MNQTWQDLERYQPRVLKLLGNSIEKDRLAHAYLFEGSKGTGKKQVALLFAKSFFCENLVNHSPCNDCRNCKRINSGNHPDLHVIEPDGQSIKKGQIQALQAEFSKTGVESNKKLYIIEHADKMTVNAANSLLKFLEEPNPQTIAILLTEQVQQILNTILSRCQVLSFQTLSPEILETELLKEGVSRHLAALVARVTNNLSDAYKLSQDDWFAEARAKVIKLYEVLMNRKGHAVLYIHNHWMPFFTEKHMHDQGLDLLLYIYKDLLSIQIGQEDQIVYLDLINMLRQQSLQLTQQRVAKQLVAILEAKKRIYANVNPQLLMEQLVLTLQEG